MEKQPKKKPHDPLKSIKFKGYCWSQTPPGDNTTTEDLVKFAKFFLCRHAHKLLNDPVWDKYTDEEILVEYYAHIYSTDLKMRQDFEVSIDAGTELYGDDIYEWLDRKVTENQAERQKKLDELPDKISFTPDQTLGED